MSEKPPDQPNSQPTAPNLDLIAMVQQARMQHDADALPSQMTGVYWIECKPASPALPTARAGAWVLHVPLAGVDAAWVAVREATRAGQLGYKSKVATASRTADVNARMIRVCTADADDADDIARVHNALLALALPGTWTYERGAESTAH